MSESGPLRDYSRSRAVLIGAWDYQQLPKVPAARHSLDRWERLLKGPLCGWPAERVEVLCDPRRREALPDRLMELFEDVEDVALFYFVGHGQLHDDQLALALCESPEVGPRRLTTGLPFSDVRAALRESRARTKVVVLDCCFSGNATRPENALTSSTADVIELASDTGAFTMAASGRYATAWFEPDSVAEPQTYFTKYLVDTVERGLPDHPGGLPLGALYRSADAALRRDRLPSPTRSVRHEADRLVFARNAALVPPQRVRAAETTPRYPDPAKSRIVLMGVPRYASPDLPEIPVIARNVTDLLSAFTDPELGGFGADVCRVVPAGASLAEAGATLARAADEAEDLLLFYYAGHGMLDSAGELFLGLAHTDDRQLLPFSALAYRSVRQVFQETPAASRVVILDTSYSGVAASHTLAGAVGPLARVEMSGTYVLTASPSHGRAMLRPDEAHTAFTERLLQIFGSGLPGAGEWLSLDDIHRGVHDLMQADGLPRPQRVSSQTAHLLKLVRNRAHVVPATRRLTGAPPLVSPEELPEDLRAGLQSERPRLRAATVRELAEWLDDADPERVLVARSELRNRAVNDVPEVADIARAALDSRVFLPDDYI